GAHRRGGEERMDGEEDASVVERRGGETDGEEPPSGDPGEAAVQPIAAGRDRGADERRSGPAQMGERDRGGVLAAGEPRQESGLQGGIGASRDEAAGALVLAFEERQGSAGARGRFLEPAEFERVESESAVLARDAQPEEP